MVIRSVNLDIVCGVTSRIPETSMPEFAFAGKSNVGKSTLINGLMNRKAYARTSAKPGKTQTINYYNVNDEFYLVDLPGYGYATAGVDVKVKWGKMIEDYLYRSTTLQTVFLLLDARHEPSENDVLMFDWVCGAGFIPVVIATKADKLKRSQLEERRKSLHDRLLTMSKYGDVADFDLIFWSGTTRDGRDEINNLIEQLIAEPTERRQLAGKAAGASEKAEQAAAAPAPSKATGAAKKPAGKAAGKAAGATKKPAGKATGAKKPTGKAAGAAKKPTGKTAGAAKKPAAKATDKAIGAAKKPAAKATGTAKKLTGKATVAGKKPFGKAAGKTRPVSAGKKPGASFGKKTGISAGKRTGTSTGKKTKR